MDDKRLELHETLLTLVDPHPVYFQPPASIRLTYPCVIYELSDINSLYADSIKYKKVKLYTITVIDSDPDSQLIEKFINLDYCEFDRHFKAENLNHYVFILFYNN